MALSLRNFPLLRARSFIEYRGRAIGWGGLLGVKIDHIVVCVLVYSRKCVYLQPN